MYEKRLCILKQLKSGFSADGAPVTGAIYCERLGGELIITPKIAGLCPLKEGRYALSVLIGEKPFIFELKGSEPFRAPLTSSLERGFSALLCFVKGEPEPVAFGACGTPVSVERLLSLFRSPLSPPEPVLKSPISPQAPLSQAPQDPMETPYDDEAIADDNFYSEKEPAKNPFLLSKGTLTYYRSIETEFWETMKKYPRSTELKSAFPSSEWVDAGNALLGVIFSGGLPRFLCVATKEPPKPLQEVCSFVPKSPFSDEEGYYVVFQDADTGEYVKCENS